MSTQRIRRTGHLYELASAALEIKAVALASIGSQSCHWNDRASHPDSRVARSGGTMPDIYEQVGKHIRELRTTEAGASAKKSWRRL
jgi:hypothetical protein